MTDGRKHFRLKIDRLRTMSIYKISLLIYVFGIFFHLSMAKPVIQIEQTQFQVPILIGKSVNPVLRIKINIEGTKTHQLITHSLQTQVTTAIQDLTTI